METEKKLKLLQIFYASVLADSTGNYENFGILGKVTLKKEAEQKIMARGQLTQLGADSPEKLFELMSEIFGCIKWNTEKYPGRYIMTGNKCILCTISKKMNVAQPCSMYCINPMKALAEALEPSWKININETLWSGNKCEFELNPIK